MLLCSEKTADKRYLLNNIPEENSFFIFVRVGDLKSLLLKFGVNVRKQYSPIVLA